MEVTKYELFLLFVTTTTLSIVSACNSAHNPIIVENERQERVNDFKNSLDSFLQDKFKRCECNKGRYKIMEEMGFPKDSKEMVDFRECKVPFTLHKGPGQFMFSGRSPGMPQYVWLDLSTTNNWDNGDRQVAVVVKQNGKQLTVTQTWNQPQNGKQKTSTTTYDFYTTERQEKRMKMVTTLGRRKGICIYQVGECPPDYRINE